ncbi:uncharacterized protein LOC131009642 [Salvia miltiorrhiza]|uniref:uncharacterized protein LOC131009642 n=1 Tax=Salvia miltiorrhiza TaxID=226208 RepID=UPI0025AB7E98|nr:uncharacterized protein LOC131009642 [Salvia miltiorrhiza]
MEERVIRLGAGATNSLLSVISDVCPSAGIDDQWIWCGTKDGSFSTKTAYMAIKASRNATAPAVINEKELAMVWDTPAIHKARVNAWRILKNRMPTCDNLGKRSVPLTTEEMTCNACFHSPESANHTFLSCPKSERVWDEVQRWMGITSARPRLIASHFVTFIHMGRGKRIEKLLKAIWMCTNWILWKRRNESRFEGRPWTIDSVISEIKARIWSWNYEFCIVEKGLSFSSWSSNDLLLKLM